MSLEKRGNHSLIFIGATSPSAIENGDEVTLYHDGNLIMVSVKSISEHQIRGFITTSAYDPDMHQVYIMGKELVFDEENIFGISKKIFQV